jgi:putative ABC transport system permease protein
LGNIIAGTVSIRQAVGNAEATLRAKMSPIAAIGYDDEKIADLFTRNPEFEPEVISVETIEKIGALPYVKSFDYSIMQSLETSFLKRYPASGATGTPSFFTFTGVNNSEMVDIQEGMIRLVAGRVFNEQEIRNLTYVALISQEVAIVNDLEVGSVMTFENVIYDNNRRVIATYRFEIIGIFESVKQPGKASNSDDWENKMYTPNRVLNEATMFWVEENTRLFPDRADSLKVFNNTTYNTIYVLNDPSELEPFKEEAAALIPEYYTVKTRENYDQVVVPIRSLQEIATPTLYVTVGAAALIMSLLILLFLRDRRREMGIYLSLGEKKVKVAGQILLEVTVVSAIAITLSLFSGNMFSNGISEKMLADQIVEQANVDTNSSNPSFLDLGARGYHSAINNDDIASSYTVFLDKATVLLFYSVGLGTVCISVLVPLFYVIQLNPKKILIGGIRDKTAFYFGSNIFFRKRNMNLLNRALASVARIPGKTIILLVIIFILGNIIAGAVSIRQAVTNAQITLRSKMSPIVTIIFDNAKYSSLLEKNPALEVEDISTETFDKIGSSSYVKYFDYSTQSLGFTGVNNPEILDIKEGFIQLVSGRVFDEKEIKNLSYVILVPQKWAEINNLTVGSIIPFEFGANSETGTKRTYDFEIIGTYKAKVMDEEFNHIYTPNRVLDGIITLALSELRKVNPSITEEEYQSIQETAKLYYSALFILNNPIDLSAFKEEVAALVPAYYTVTAVSNSFEIAAASLQSIQEIMTLVLFVSVGAVVLAMSLLITLFLRDRRQEIGIYLSLGERKFKVAGQIFVEVAVIALIAITLSLFAGNALFGAISEQMLINQMAADQVYGEYVPGEYAYRYQGATGAEQLAESYVVSLDTTIVLLFYLIGFATVCVSVLIPIFYITRLNPKKILIGGEL